MSVNRSIALGLLLFSLNLYALEPEKHGAALVYSVESTFADVKSDIVEAITNRGMVISYTAHVKNMLDRTAGAVDIKESVYEDGETILICKSGLSHQLAKSNPHNIVLCPWGISVYTLKGKPSMVYVSIRESYEDESYKEIQKLLQDIIQDAIGG